MNRRLLTVAVAIALGLVGTLAVLFYVRGADNRAVARIQARDVLVAAKTIPGGTAVGDLVPGGYVKTEKFPVGSLPPDALASLSQLGTSEVVQTTVQSGQLLTASAIVPKGTSQSFTIPSGKIAISLSIASPAQVAGYIEAGAKVVVFTTGSQGSGGGKGTATRTLIIDLPVLAVGPAGAAQSATSGAQLVTIAVTQGQAEKLIYAAGNGGLYLGLESDSSTLNPNMPGVSGVNLFAATG